MGRQFFIHEDKCPHIWCWSHDVWRQSGYTYTKLQTIQAPHKLFVYEVCPNGTRQIVRSVLIEIAEGCMLLHEHSKGTQIGTNNRRFSIAATTNELLFIHILGANGNEVFRIMDRCKYSLSRSMIKMGLKFLLRFSFSVVHMIVFCWTYGDLIWWDVMLPFTSPTLMIFEIWDRRNRASDVTSWPSSSLLSNMRAANGAPT